MIFREFNRCLKFLGITLGRFQVNVRPRGLLKINITPYIFRRANKYYKPVDKKEGVSLHR